MIDLTVEESMNMRERFQLVGVLGLGGLLYLIADLITNWLVKLFSATLTLPAPTVLGLTILVFAGLVYGVALHVEPDHERTILEKLLARGSA